MKLKKNVIAKMLKKTFIRVIQEKMDMGTLLFGVSLFDKSKNKINFYQETMEINLEKTIEGVDFIYCNLQKVCGGNIIKFIIGVNSITGLSCQIEKRLELAVEYFFAYEKIDLYSEFVQIKTKKMLEQQFFDFHSINGETSRYYSIGVYINLDLIANIHEILFLRKLMTFSSDSPKIFLFLPERNEFDAISFINLINNYLLKNNLAINGNKIYKKEIEGNKITWNYFSEISFIENNFHNILVFVKKEFPGQLNNININYVVLRWGVVVYELLQNKPSLLIKIYVDNQNEIYGRKEIK